MQRYIYLIILYYAMFKYDYAKMEENRIMELIEQVREYEQIDRIEDSMKLVNGEY